MTSMRFLCVPWILLAMVWLALGIWGELPVALHYVDCFLAGGCTMLSIGCLVWPVKKGR